METKKNKNVNILKIISAIISIAIIAICICVYYKRLYRMIFIPQNAITMVLLFGMFSIVLYMYIYGILKLLKKKKIIRLIILVLLILGAVIGIVFIKNHVNYVFRNIILMLVFILGIICLPLIILGKVILENNSKHKKLKILVVCIIMIYVYISNWNWMIDYAKKIISNLSEYSANELITLREEEKVDTTYLYEYNQVLAKKGYLSQFDIKNLIDIADSKSNIIWINYKDAKENIELNIENKKDDEIQKLKDTLKSDYYTFSYTTNENGEVVINIDRYVINENNTSEKRKDIILTGKKNSNIIKNINKNVPEYYNSFIFENEVNVESDPSNKSLKSFKILISYDEAENNYIPVVEDEKEYELIHSYRVYQSGIDIILKEDVTIENKDYTIRINRYDNNLNVKENSDFYEYEPVVTQMTTYKNKVVLEMRFDKSYTVEELKNIEIIFGK